nr:NADH dehydrogenase subunit 4 [Claraeola sicilis]
MLKFVFFLLFLLPLSLLKGNFWMVQNLLFMFFMLFVQFNVYSNFWSSMSYFLGCDLLSYGLVLLSVWICSLMLMASESIYKFNNYCNLFLLNLIMLLILLMLAFMSMDLFMFYLFFEGSLIPTLFLILGWGYQPERLQAGMYLLFYTLLVSLPMLLGIFYLYMNFYSLNMYMFNWLLLDYLILCVCLISAFLVKMPMFLVHLWLPSAHVEAPVSGSMILAGIMLKLGGYGLLRIMVVLQNVLVKYSYVLISVSLLGGVLISLVCLRQSDLKSLIAYSSVAHMGMVIGGMMTLTYWGLCGSYGLMIAHGLCSSGLFCLANISYERTGSRSLLINSGLLVYMPSMGLFWFLLCSCNMAAPPSLNLLGEIALLNSIISWSWLSMFMLIFLSFFSAAYTLYLFSYSQHGSGFSGFYLFSSGKLREYLLLFLHWISLNLLVMSSDMCLLWL